MVRGQTSDEEDPMGDLAADTDEIRSLTCRQCGQSPHRFVQYDGIPFSAREDTEPATGTATDEEAVSDEPVGQPIWRCQQCQLLRHGPDPHSDAEADQFDAERSNVSDTREGVSNERPNDLSDILGTPNEEIEVERGELGELEHLVLNAMKSLDEGEGVDRERLVTAVQTDHTVSAADIEDATESLLRRGECYEPTDTTVKPL